jgi:hypothetical protein
MPIFGYEAKQPQSVKQGHRGRDLLKKLEGKKSCEIVLIIVMVQSLVRGLDEDATLKPAD